MKFEGPRIALYQLIYLLINMYTVTSDNKIDKNIWDRLLSRECIKDFREIVIMGEN
jgi:hypothetical protein